MGAYCLRALILSHTALVGEIMEVLWSDYYGAVIFGDRREIACIPHKGCRLEIVATGKVVVRDEALPKTPVGKIKRRDLREPYWVGHTRRVAGS